MESLGFLKGSAPWGVLVDSFVSQLIQGQTEAEYVQEQGAEEDIWA